jgi:hypothetical protein
MSAAAYALPEVTVSEMTASGLALPEATAAEMTSPEGIEVILVDFSPEPAGVALVPPEAPAPWIEPHEPASIDDADVAEAPAGIGDVHAPSAAAPPVESAPEAQDVASVDVTAVEIVAIDGRPPLEVTPLYGNGSLTFQPPQAVTPSSIAPWSGDGSALDATPAPARLTLPWPLALGDALPAQYGHHAATTLTPASPEPGPAEADAVEALPAEAACAEQPSAAPPDTRPPEALAPIDAIVWSASRGAGNAPGAAKVDARARVDELVARFAARSESSTQRRAARSMKALAGLDLTLTPPPVAAVSLAGASPAAAPPAGSPRPAPHGAELGAGVRAPLPLVPARRRSRTRWLAFVALALLCVGLVWTLRPALLASLVQPLARGALHASPYAEAKVAPAHD